jgi:hypothetical protein
MIVASITVPLFRSRFPMRELLDRCEDQLGQAVRLEQVPEAQDHRFVGTTPSPS